MAHRLSASSPFHNIPMLLFLLKLSRSSPRSQKENVIMRSLASLESAARICAVPEQSTSKRGPVIGEGLHIRERDVRGGSFRRIEPPMTEVVASAWFCHMASRLAKTLMKTLKPFQQDTFYARHGRQNASSLSTQWSLASTLHKPA